jgi:uncharacterized protein (DUF1800 family)
MESTNRVLAAHLARRAGFGGTLEELDSYSEMEYEDLVEHLITKIDSSHISDHLIFRRHVDLHTMQGHNAVYWGYRMISTDNPFLEKMALFWHGVFATAENKLNNIGSLTNQIDMFRRHGIGRYDDLLVELSKDPAMLIWLDNHTNHKDSINENYGREILELFSMGVGNYTEDDIKECARAFTGWTVKNGEYLSMMAVKDSIWPYGRILWHHEYRATDHDTGEKRFLCENSNFNGDGVIDVICRQRATANFVARHLYNFFVADEVPVPQWSSTPPKDPEAINILADTYIESNHDIRSIMRVKSPAELIIGTLRNTREYQVPDGGETGIYDIGEESGYMGQKLLDPPSVEGWHTGEEWITSGSLVDRVNFATSHISDDSNPGVKSLIERVGFEGKQPSKLIADCLETLGCVEIETATYQKLEEVAAAGLKKSDSSEGVSSNLIIELFKLIVSSREYQRC